MRASGILMPISSLPNKYGIGTFGKEAYQFVDFLEKANQKYWQVLPLGPTSFGDSPYQSFSVFAGNPYYIDLDLLMDSHLLDEHDYSYHYSENKNINYSDLYSWRYKVLKKAYGNFIKKSDIDFYAFQNDNHWWLNDYALFMTLKKSFSDKSWDMWPDQYRFYDLNVLNEIAGAKKEDYEFWQFVQYVFFKQWQLLKEYANKKGIDIIGDIPIYVAYDSSDVWANPNYFQLDHNRKPKRVAGCPPDAFSDEGQLWGNPLYDYNEHEQDNYQFWIKRMIQSLKMYDVIRIDHFRGFESYYSIDGLASNAKNGRWEKGPGLKLFNAIKKQLGSINIIAEDLGFLTEEVHQLLKDTGFPGMKVLEFAFDPNSDSLYLSHNHQENAVVYTGTHDNAPLAGWFETLDEKTRKFCFEYLNIQKEEDKVEAVVRMALSSVCRLAIIPIQDYLKLGLEARINTPAIPYGNWTWRIERDQLSDDLAKYIKYLTKIYRR